MHAMETLKALATHGGELFQPMSQPCSLCLPLHSSCDQTTCPSLLLFHQIPYKTADAPLNDEYWIMSTPVFRLEKSASIGCVVCATLYTGLLTDGRCHDSRNRALVRVARNGHVGVETGCGYMTELSFYTTRDADESRKCMAFPALTACQSTNTGSVISFNQTKEWIQMCKNHPHCSGELDSILPTRVLDIGDRPGQDFQLLETYGKVGQYIALSHCWGTSPMIQTTSANIAERKRGIPFSQLPKTFQEASSLSRHLGIRYLWIDSLCIIQDDKLDWQRESAQMASIYAKAALTIAASASQDSKGGCFKPTPQLSGCNSWEIAVEYKSLTDAPAEAIAGSEAEVVKRNSEDPPWLDDEEMEKYWEPYDSRGQWNPGGQVHSTFGSSTQQFSIVRYLPGSAPLASVPSKHSINKFDSTKISEINSDRNTGTKEQPEQVQKPSSFRGRVELLEHSTGVYVRNTLGHLEFAPDRGFVHPTKLPLASRAWAFQERLLSTRILHFTASELVWECLSESCCQCGLVGCDAQWGIGSEFPSAKTLKLAFDDAIREASGGNPEQIEDMWQKLVSNYTLKALTHKTDRLPAASGLMKRLQQANMGECFAGMWRKYLPEHMMWSVAAAKNIHARHEAYVAPTWSWASVTAPVDFPTFIHAASTLILPTTIPKPVVVAEIINVQYASAGLDTTGSLSDGVLTIRAPALPALLLSSQRENSAWDSPSFPGSCTFACEIYSPHNGTFAPFHPDSYSDIDGSVERQEVLCVQWTKPMDLESVLAECRALEWQGDWFSLNAEFLVLRRSHKRRGKYERVGMVTVASVHRKPDYRPGGKQTPMEKWFQGASVQTLDLI